MTRYFSTKETAEKYAKRYKCKISKCILLLEDGSPILDMGEPVEVWKVTKGKQANINPFGIGLQLQEEGKEQENV